MAAPKKTSGKKPSNTSTNKRKQGVNRKVADGSRNNVKKKGA